MASDSDYQNKLAAYRKRRTFELSHLESLAIIADEFNLNEMESCLSFGPGTGDVDVEFIVRSMPKLRKFIGVEPDGDALAKLKERLKTRLPHMTGVFHETYMQNYVGTESVDIILSFHVFQYLDKDEMKAMFQKMHHWLNPGGLIIISQRSREGDCYCEIINRLGGSPVCLEDMERDILEAGFELIKDLTIRGEVDLSDPDEDLIGYFYSEVSNKQVSLETVGRVVGVVSRSLRGRRGKEAIKKGVFRKNRNA